MLNQSIQRMDTVDTIRFLVKVKYLTENILLILSCNCLSDVLPVVGNKHGWQNY